MININQTIYRECIKYERMFHLTKIAFYQSKADELNVYIDLYPIIRTLFRPDYLEFHSPVDLCSGILNIAAHYRNFFRSWFRTETKIYLINSLNINDSYEGYNSEFVHRFNTATEYTHRIVDNNFDLLRTLIPYIPEVYLVDSPFESSVVMYDLINNYSGGRPNLIISRDPYPKQLVGVCKDTVLYKPNFEKSYHVCKNNLYKSVIYDMKLKQDRYDFSDVSPALLSVLFTLNKLDCRNIKMEYNFPTSYNIIKNAIYSRSILNNYNSYIDWNMIQDKREFQEMQNRFEVIDVISQYQTLKNNISAIYNFQDLYDPESVKAINNMYFTKNNQIDLNAF